MSVCQSTPKLSYWFAFRNRIITREMHRIKKIMTRYTLHVHGILSFVTFPVKKASAQQRSRNKSRIQTVLPDRIVYYNWSSFMDSPLHKV